jgi:hypothetical protein
VFTATRDTQAVAEPAGSGPGWNRRALARIASRQSWVASAASSRWRKVRRAIDQHSPP